MPRSVIPQVTVGQPTQPWSALAEGTKASTAGLPAALLADSFPGARSACRGGCAAAGMAGAHGGMVRDPLVAVGPLTIQLRSLLCRRRGVGVART